MGSSDRSFNQNSQYVKALDEVVKAGDALTDTLTEEQKEVFEDYMTAQREVNVLTDCETFIYSFRLAAKIMIDVLTEGQMREIRYLEKSPEAVNASGLFLGMAAY